MTHVISKKYHCAALTQRKFGLVIGGDKVGWVSIARYSTYSSGQNIPLFGCASVFEYVGLWCTEYVLTLWP